jgi:RNA polymerase sigma-70 factor (ECF subfamily)
MTRWRRADPEDAFLQATQPAVDLVHNLARRLTATTEDAEDLVQDAYLRAWRAWRSGTRPRRVEPWLATICLNLGRDRARQEARGPQSTVIDLELRLDEPSDVAETAVARAEIETALAHLPEAKRIAVVLSDICGLTAREVAEVTGCPLGTALARIHRGRRALAEQLTGTSAAPRQRGGESDAPRS